MSGPAPRLFTISPDVPFLRALARAILAGGFPLPDTPAPGLDDLFADKTRRARPCASLPR